MSEISNAKTKLEEIIRFCLVLLWLIILLIYHDCTGSSFFKCDIMNSHDSIPFDSTFIELLSDSGDAKLTSHFCMINSSIQDTDNNKITITEYKKYNSQILNEDIIFNNKDREIDLDIFSKTASLFDECNSNFRIFIFSDSKEYENIGCILTIWKIIKVSLYGLLVIGILAILALSPKTHFLRFLSKIFFLRLLYKKLRKLNLTNVTIIFICLIGLIQSSFIVLQGGLLISPVGKASSTIILILLTHSMTLIKIEKSKCTKKLFWFLPSFIFVVGHLVAHRWSGHIYSETSKAALNIVLAKYDFYAYFSGAIFSIGSFWSRLISANSDEMLEGELEKIKNITSSDLNALRPKVIDKESFDILIAAVEEATRKNENLASLKLRIEKLGPKVVKVFREVLELIK